MFIIYTGSDRRTYIHTHTHACQRRKNKRWKRLKWKRYWVFCIITCYYLLSFNRWIIAIYSDDCHHHHSSPSSSPNCIPVVCLLSRSSLLAILTSSPQSVPKILFVEASSRCWITSSDSDASRSFLPLTSFMYATWLTCKRWLQKASSRVSFRCLDTKVFRLNAVCCFLLQVNLIELRNVLHTLLFINKLALRIKLVYFNPNFEK